MNTKITIPELAEALARRKGITRKEADAFLHHMFDIVEEYLLKDKVVKVKGLGTFKIIMVESRESVNVNTGERFTIEGHPRMTFTPDAVLRDQINKPFADFQTVVLNEDTDVAVMESAEFPLEPLPPLPESEPVEDTPVEEENTPAEEVPAQEDTAVAAVVQKILATEETKEDVAEEAQETVPESTVDVAEEQTVSVMEEESAESSATVEDAQQVTVVDNVEVKQKCSHPCLWILLACFGFILCFVGGYYVGVHYSDAVDGAMSDIKARFNQANTKQTEVKQETTVQEVQEKVDVEPEETSAVDPVADSLARVAKLREEAKKYKQMYIGNWLIVGTRTTHAIKQGDSFAKLAKQYYGDYDMGDYIVIYNELSNPDKIHAGMEVKIPELIPRK